MPSHLENMRKLESIGKGLDALIKEQESLAKPSAWVQLDEAFVRLRATFAQRSGERPRLTLIQGGQSTNVDSGGEDVA